MRVKKNIILICVVLSSLFTTSCITIPNWGLKQDRQEIVGEISRKEGELDRHTRAFVSGTVDALSLSDDKSKEDLVALELAQKAQEIVGLPQPGDKIHVEDVISNNEMAIDNLTDRNADVIELSRRKEILGHDLKDTEEKLISLGELKAKEQKEGFFDSMWSYLTTTFGLVGAIAILVIGGPALLPIITQLIGWLVGKIPGLITWLGITSSQMTSNIIKGVHDAKERIRAVDDDKKLSKNEVLTIFGSSLGNSTNVSDKNAIDRIKRKFK
tara:strand:+ start:14169 stop:14978 length:810 start_codon:yes stop_codon:yes gene_type:complete